MLQLQYDKTKSVLFGTVKRLSMNDELRIDLQGKPIKNVTSYKYLGVYLDRGLTFIEHINRLKMKVAKRLGALTRSRPILTSYAAIKVYTAMVLPVFDYCDVVWDTLSDTQQHKLEKLQSRAEKIINMYQSYELNIHWPSLVSRRKMHTAILVFKCLTRNCAHKCVIPKVKLVFQ